MSGTDAADIVAWVNANRVVSYDALEAHLKTLGVVAETVAEREARLAADFAAGRLSVNGMRAEYGLPPVPEGGA